MKIIFLIILGLFWCDDEAADGIALNPDTLDNFG